MAAAVRGEIDAEGLPAEVSQGRAGGPPPRHRPQRGAPPFPPAGRTGQGPRHRDPGGAPPPPPPRARALGSGPRADRAPRLRGACLRATPLLLVWVELGEFAPARASISDNACRKVESPPAPSLWGSRERDRDRDRERERERGR